MADKTKSAGSAYGWAVVVVTMLAGFVPASNMAKVTSLAPVVSQTFGFNPDVLGWVIALFYVMGIVMAFPTTAFINKLGIRGAVTIAVATGVIGGIMGAVSGTNAALFCVSRVFEGAGFGIMGVAGSSAIAPWFVPEKRSVPLGIWSMWVAAMMCICPILFGWVVDTLGMSWETVWWGCLVYDIVALVLFLVVYRAPADPAMSEEEIAAANRGKAVFARAYKSKMLWGLYRRACLVQEKLAICGRLQNLEHSWQTALFRRAAILASGRECRTPYLVASLECKTAKSCLGQRRLLGWQRQRVRCLAAFSKHRLPAE